MFSSNDLNNMNDLDLKNLILRINQYYPIINTNYKKILVDDNNPKHIQVKKILSNFLYHKFLNNDFINAFDINNKYKKELEIFKNLIFYNDGYYSLFKSLIWTEQSSSIYDELIWFLKTQNLDNDQYDIISNYLNNEKAKMILRSGRNDYNTLNNEVKNLNNFMKGFTSNEYISFRNLQRSLFNKNEIEIEQEYKAKKIGNIGEIISYDYLNKMKTNPYFVSKKCGDGFGYDIFFEYLYNNLIEVKTTLKYNTDDYFKLSNNEYNIMLDTLDLHDTNYYIFRVFVNILDNNDIRYSIDSLKSVNEKTLISTYDGKKYELDDSKEKIFIKK